MGSDDPSSDTQLTSMDYFGVYLEASKKLDDQVRHATSNYESTIKDLSGEIMTVDSERVILDLISKTPSAQGLKQLIPSGLPPVLESKVLGIFANLVSRISGLRGTFYHADMSDIGEVIAIRNSCFRNVLSSQNQFKELLTDAKVLAHSQPFSARTPASIAAAEMAIRVAYIWKVNNCCDSCGGYLYEEPLDISWDNHTVNGIKFNATFNGQEWEVFLNAG